LVIEMTLKLYFLRHGETAHSKTGNYCGATDAPLTDIGEAMAQHVADAYSSLPWTAVYCSPMARTIATAKPICDRIGLTPQLRDGLKEIYYGDWEDRTNDDVRVNHRADYDRWVLEPAWNAPTGGENGIQVATRAMAVISEIQTQYSDGNILIVSHKATIRLLLCSLLGIDLGRYRDRLNILAASISVVSFGKYGAMLEVLGDRQHLPPHLTHLPSY
jgi:broad specificity phosphatase PhoE